MIGPMKPCMVFLVPPLLASCAGTAAPTSGGMSRTAAPKAAELTTAATTPLADLNLLREAIPAALQGARKAPYGPVAQPGCEGIGAEVRELDAALGADLDTPGTAADPGLIERGAGWVGEEVVGAVRSTAEGVLPFRSWVRRLSGAQRASREVAAAVAAGTVRRAYLKGLGRSQGCAAPAAPQG